MIAGMNLNWSQSKFAAYFELIIVTESLQPYTKLEKQIQIEVMCMSA